MGKYRYENPIPMNRGTHYGNNYYIFKSRKVGRIVTAFSNLEYDNLITLEMDHKVEYFCEQPCKVSFMEEGIKEETVFDVWVFYRDGREEYQEVKYNSEINNHNPDSRDNKQIKLQKKWCDYNNQNYVVRTEKELHRGQYYMMNLEYMASKVRRYSIPIEIQVKKEHELIKMIKDNYLTVGDIISCGLLPLGREPEFLSMIYYKGLICFSNMEDTIINTKTEVYLNG